MMFVIILLPLVPILLVFIKGKYDSSPMNYLVLVCLLDIITGLCGRWPQLVTGNLAVTRNIVTVLGLSAQVQLFKTAVSRNARITWNIVFVAALSAILTWFSVSGWTSHDRVLDTVSSTLILVAIYLGLLPLMRDRMLQIFQSPLVFIGAGSLFYTVTFLLVEWAGPCCPTGVAATPPEATILLCIAAVIKYTLYTQATLVGGEPKNEKE